MELKKVLLADDSRIFRALMCEVLREHGVEVFEASNGREALAMLQQSLALNPNLRNAYYLIGVIEGKQMRDEKGALAAFKRAAALGQTDAQKILLDRGVDW